MGSGTGRLLIGTSGWSYDSWVGDFYPVGPGRRDDLAYIGERLPSLEINASFYRLQRPETYQRWYDAVPHDHVFAVKGSRYLTHLKRLRDVEAGLANLLASGVFALGEKLGVMLWQLPADLPFDAGLLADFLDVLPRDRGSAARTAELRTEKVREDRVLLDASRTPEVWRHALEPRHPSFRDEKAVALLAERDVALVHADSAGRWPVFDCDTASFRYVRLHGHSELYTSRYADRTLDGWAERCRAWSDAGQDVHLYFDNDARGHAPHDALRLLGRLGVPAGVGAGDRGYG